MKSFFSFSYKSHWTTIHLLMIIKPIIINVCSCQIKLIKKAFSSKAIFIFFILMSSHKKSFYVETSCFSIHQIFHNCQSSKITCVFFNEICYESSFESIETNEHLTFLMHITHSSSSAWSNIVFFFIYVKLTTTSTILSFLQRELYLHDFWIFNLIDSSLHFQLLFMRKLRSSLFWRLLL